MGLSAGSKLGSYEIVSLIGAGGMGEVYRARDSRLGREVAIKVLPAERVADEGRRRRFIQEAQAASALNHPHIVTIHEIESAGDVDFIVMEYVRGRSLDALIPRGGMRLGELLRIAIAIADALAAAHARGIIHRDLKPANVVVGQDGAVKVLDFGLAKLIGTDAGPDEETLTHLGTVGLSMPGTIAGTAAYMAPEQATGGKVDARSDIFSFGAMLYEMATGTRAFTGDSTADTLAAVVRTQPTPPTQIVTTLPRELERLILRCLRKDPERRYHTIVDVKVELQDIKEDSDSGAIPPAAFPGRRRTRRRVTAAAIAAAVVAAGVWFFWPGSALDMAPMRIVPLTTLKGAQTGPTLSPDGEQVAFTWNGEAQDNFDIYVKGVGSTELRRLTTDSAIDYAARWSPDGRHIAFVRLGPDGPHIRLVSPIAGADRRVSDFPAVASIAWSPDSRWIAAAGDPSEEGLPFGARAIHFIPVEGGESRLVVRAQPSEVIRGPAFSPDGRHLSYISCVGAFGTTCEIHAVEIGAREVATTLARRVITRPFHGIYASPVWTSDGRSIVFGALAGPGIQHLWRVEAFGDGQPERIEVAGAGVGAVALAPRRDRLVFERHHGGLGIYAFDPTGPGRPLIVSSAGAATWDYHPSFSADGTRIAFSSSRSGDAVEIWLAGADGSGARQLTRGPGQWQGSPAWSPDGRWIAFDSRRDDGQWDIWVIDADGGMPRQLTSEAGDENVPTWSADGSWIYFSARSSDQRNMRRMPAGGGRSTRLTNEGSGMLGYESPDRQHVLHQPSDLESPLLASPLAGGAARELAPCVNSFRSFTVGRTGIYFLGCGAPEAPLHHLDPATGRIRVLGRIPTQTGGDGFAVSPDGQTVLHPRRSGGLERNLVMIENFR